VLVPVRLDRDHHANACTIRDEIHLHVVVVWFDARDEIDPMAKLEPAFWFELKKDPVHLYQLAAR
jgi:hypothetical protein